MAIHTVTAGFYVWRPGPGTVRARRMLRER